MNRKRRQATENENDNDAENGFAEWGGYMAAKKSKLAEQYAQQVQENSDQQKSEIFKGISIFVNGYTKPSAEELKQIMAEHGGVYHHYQMSGKNKTGFIIASNLPNTKIKQLRSSERIVKPDWITASLKAGKLLDYRNFLLCTVNDQAGQNKLNLVKVDDSERNTARTAVDPKFLSEFYNNSRLHLISTLGATFKQKINHLRDQHDGKFPSRDILRNISTNTDIEFGLQKIIMHIDMDCFFVSVGLLKRPELANKPVAVTHGRSDSTKTFEHSDGSMSEIASCSYEARKMGVKNGMFVGTALKLCPNLKTIPYDFDEYKRIAHILYDTIAKYTLDIEAVSCDEMFVDITELLKSSSISVDQWAEFIRKEISNLTGCTCSAGFGANRLQARLATRKAKPNGHFWLQPHLVDEYMESVSVDHLPGVGRTISHRLKALNLNTCGDLQEKTLQKLQDEFGQRMGSVLYENCRGNDSKALEFEHVRKSVSAEVNFGIRFTTNEQTETFLRQVCQEVHTRLMAIAMLGKCVTLKLMIRAKDAPVETTKYLGHGICDYLTKSSTFNTPTDDLSIIFSEVLSIARKINFNPQDLRGIGVQITKLEKKNQTSSVRGNLNKFLVPSIQISTISTTAPKSAPVENKPNANNYNLRARPREKEKKKPEVKGRRGRKKKIEIGTNTESINKYTVPILKETTNQMNENEIDFEVLETLPEDIRLEIIAAYNLEAKLPKSNDKVERAPDQIDLEILKELPQDIRMEVINQYHLPMPQENQEKCSPNENNYDFKPNVDVKPIFYSKTWTELKDLLKEWMREDDPLDCDTELFGDFLVDMALIRKTEFLFKLFKFLYRNFSNLHCKWHIVYKVLTSRVQKAIVSIYNYELSINNFIVCEICE